MKLSKWIVLGLIAALLLGACVPLAAATQTPPDSNNPDLPVTSGDSTPLPGPGTGNTGGSVEMRAVEALVKQLGINSEAIKVTSIEPVDWPNTCLGAEQPGEACAEMIVSGFKVTLEAGGKAYEVHTNGDGSNLRVVEGALQSYPPPGDPQPEDQILPAVAAAVQALASQLGISADQVKMVRFEPVEWSDGCLGLGGPAESCLMATVPGYRVSLEVNGRMYEVRTDQNGSQVRLNPMAEAGTENGAPAQDGEDLVLVFQRNGGIAGLCDTLEITSAGEVTASTCKGEPAHFYLTPLQQMLLKTWIEQYGSFEYQQTDPASADAMTTYLAFYGSGSAAPSAVEQEEIVNFAASVFGQH